MKSRIIILLWFISSTFLMHAYDGEVFTDDYHWGTALDYRVISEDDATAEIIGHHSDEEQDTYWDWTWPYCFYIFNTADKRLNEGTNETKSYSIIAIADGAFQNWDKPCIIDMGSCSQLIKVGEYAFAGCTDLIKISFPETLKEIRSHAFDGCVQLSQADLNDNIQKIGEYAFRDCKTLHEPHIPSEMTIIEEGTFQGCENFRKVIIPDNIVEIDDYAFADCINLNQFVLGKSVTATGELFLNHTWSLEDIFCMPITPPRGISLSEKYADFVEGPGGGVWLKHFWPKVYVPSESIKYYRREWWGFVPREDFKESPNVFAIFSKDEYEIKYSDYCTKDNQVTLDYNLFRLYDDIDVESMNWDVVNTAALDVIDGIAYSKGKVGERTKVTLTIKDTSGSTYKTSCFVYIGGYTSIPAIETDSKSADGVYNLNGLRVGDTTEGLAPGLYIVREGSSTHKIMVR